MPNYNHGKFIGEAIQAIVEQSRLPDEFIIIDDASTDNSVEIIRIFAKKYNFIKFFQNEKNMGSSYTQHKLLEYVNNDYVYGAASDDRVLQGFIEKSMNILETHSNAGMCSTLVEFIDENGKTNGINNIAKFTDKATYISPSKCLKLLNNYESWLSISGNTTVYRKSALDVAGDFIPELESYADGFTRKVIALKFGACFIPEPLGAWRRMESGYYANEIQRLFSEKVCQ